MEPILLLLRQNRPPSPLSRLGPVWYAGDCYTYGLVQFVRDVDIECVYPEIRKR
jgi:hypothetical protein